MRKKICNIQYILKKKLFKSMIPKSIIELGKAKKCHGCRYAIGCPYKWWIKRKGE